MLPNLLLLLGLWVLPWCAVAQSRTLTVAQDGSASYTTVQAAIDAAPDYSAFPTTIYIHNGVYKERLVIPASKRNLRLVGESEDSTILTYDNYASKKNVFGDPMGTSGSSSIYIYADDFRAENLTFENSSGPVGQAVAVWVSGDRDAFFHCRLLGFQDTLYTYGNGSREYYQDCDIEGTTDFIFGSAIALFRQCTIVCKAGGHYVTAASTLKGQPYGYVFKDCRIAGDAPAGSFFLGRPWRPFARVVYIRCYLGAQIRPEGWVNWHDTENDKTAYYAEYHNTGPGFQPDKRVSWSHQLSSTDMNAYRDSVILNHWNPLN